MFGYQLLKGLFMKYVTYTIVQNKKIELLEYTFVIILMNTH